MIGIGKNTKLSDLELIVDPKIYERGVDYFNRGKIKKIVKISPEMYWAKIDSSNYPDTYDSYIYLKDGFIDRFYCECPCGYLCKHIVAMSIHMNSNKKIIISKKKCISDNIEEALEYIMWRNAAVLSCHEGSKYKYYSRACNASDNVEVSSLPRHLKTKFLNPSLALNKRDKQEILRNLYFKEEEEYY